MLCKGCGTCASACPSSAIIQNHFGSDQLSPMINNAVQKASKIKE
ncbi:MAG: 4Fe-4S binding protein [Promethearchaeota archaeon]